MSYRMRFFFLEDTDYAPLTSEPLLRLAQVLTTCWRNARAFCADSTRTTGSHTGGESVFTATAFRRQITHWIYRHNLSNITWQREELGPAHQQKWLKTEVHKGQMRWKVFFGPVLSPSESTGYVVLSMRECGDQTRQSQFIEYSMAQPLWSMVGLGFS